MRFVTRSLMGLFLLALTLGLLGLAGNTMFKAYEKSANGGRGPGEVRERVFTVEVMPVRIGTETPVITTFGEVISGRTLELRAAASGEIVQLSDNFREGGFVTKGEVLFQTDPATARSRLAIARNELAEAQADLADARRSLALADEEIIAAASQLELRKRAMNRQDNLRSRGVGTDAAMETAELAVAAAEQSLLSKRLAQANAQARIARTETTVDRMRINAEEAERLLADTTVVADFDGVLSEVSAVLGRLANANEKLGNLIDPDALEVSFRVSNEDFRALTGNPAGLGAARVLVGSAGSGVQFEGSIDRVSAAVGAGRTGRELFAKLGVASMLTVRPGDFVSVEVEEPALDNVARIPATAASTSGEVLLVGPDDRLESATVEVLRRQRESLIVRTDDLADRQLVIARAPQLGAGIKVKPRNPGGPAIEDREMVALEPARRDRLVAAVTANQRMPQQARDRILRQLEQDEIPAEMLARLESRMNPAPPETSETVEVSDDQRQRMIAFVQASDRIPADRKTQMIETLSQPVLPKEMVDRITQRMGG